MEDTTQAANPAAVLKVQVDQLIAQMGQITVDSDEKYAACEEWLRRNKETQKMVAEVFEPRRVEAKAAYDAVLVAKSAYVKPLEQAEQVVRNRMTSYSTEREKRRREEERKALEEARKAKESNVLEEAETLQAMGRQDAADELLSKEVRVSKASVAAAVQTQKVGKTMEKWVVRVTDKSEFLKFAASAHVSILECVDVSETKLAALARQNKGLTAPGLAVEQTFVPVV